MDGTSHGRVAQAWYSVRTRSPSARLASRIDALSRYMFTNQKAITRPSHANWPILDPTARMGSGLAVTAATAVTVTVLCNRKKLPQFETRDRKYVCSSRRKSPRSSPCVLPVLRTHGHPPATPKHAHHGALPLVPRTCAGVRPL